MVQDILRQNDALSTMVTVCQLQTKVLRLVISPLVHLEDLLFKLDMC